MCDASVDIDDAAEAGGESRVVRIERIQLEIVRTRFFTCFLGHAVRRVLAIVVFFATLLGVCT